MKLVTSTILVSLVALFAVCGISEPDNLYPTVERPGLKPMLFAPGLVSTDGHRERDLAVAPDWSEIYFSRDATIMVTHRTDSGWSLPEPVAFSYDCPEFEPFITRDNQRLYYISRRPLSGDGDPEEYQLWLVNRNATGWSEPIRVTDQGDFYPSVTDDDIIYFTDAHNDLYRSPLRNGLPVKREKLSDSVNTPAAEYNSYIASDESYLLFTSHGWGATSPAAGVLYVAWNDQDGGWSRPANLGTGVNGANLSYCPSLSPDGKYLFFAMRSGRDENIYWVDADLLNHAREHDLDFKSQVLELIRSQGLANLEVGLGEIETSMRDYCDLTPQLLASVVDWLMAEKRDAEAAGLMRYISERFAIPDSPIGDLKMAVLTQDTMLWKQALDQLARDTTAASETEINLLGYLFLQAGRIKQATRLFHSNVELFPTSANVFDSYGEALLVTGDTLGAIENYRRSLELNAENVNATHVLERLDVN